MTETGQGRDWILTLNNPRHHFNEQLPGFPNLSDEGLFKYFFQKADLRYGIGQLERGEEGTEHFQTFIVCDRSRRFAWVRALLGPLVHIERVRNRRASIDYCQKSETRISGPYEFGTLPGEGSGARSDLYELAERINQFRSVRAIAAEYPREFIKYHQGLRKLHSHTQQSIARAYRHVRRSWIYGGPGIGKSRFVYDLFQRIANGDGFYWKSFGAIPYFDGYAGERLLILDEFREESLKMHEFLDILDGYPCQMPVKGDFVHALWDEVIVISNNEPRYFYATTDNVPMLSRFRPDRNGCIWEFPELETYDFEMLYNMYMDLHQEF